MNWYKTISHIWEHSNLEDTELLLMLAIAHHINKRGVAYPSVKRLAKFIRRSSKTVKRLVRKLEAEGYLKVQYGAGPKGTNEYRVTLVQGDTQMSRGGTSNGHLSGDTQMSPELLTSEPSKKEEAKKLEAWNNEFWKRGSVMWEATMEEVERSNGQTKDMTRLKKDGSPRGKTKKRLANEEDE